MSTENKNGGIEIRRVLSIGVAKTEVCLARVVKQQHGKRSSINWCCKVILTLKVRTQYMRRFPFDSVRVWSIGYRLIVATLIGKFSFSIQN